MNELENATQRIPSDVKQIRLGTFRCSEAARRYVNQVLDSGRVTYGPFSRRFEREFAGLHDCEHGIVSNSGTSALQMALAAMRERHGWDDGDEVIVPGVTFVATANVVVHNGLQPVAADVDLRDYGLSPEAFERAITPRTRAVIPVHLFGQPCDMDPILEIAKRHNLAVIEDSCETLFARYHGRSVGSLGEIGCFSTYAAHLLVTGVGGLNTTSDPDYMAVLRSLANHGRDTAYLSIDDDEGLPPEELVDVVARRFRFVRIGFSNRISELEAALGVAALEDWEDMIARRRANGARLTESLRALADRLLLPECLPDRDHSFMMYPLVVRGGSKTRLVEYLELHGIETREMMPLTNQPALRNILRFDPDAMPATDWINQSGFYVGCHQELGMEEMDRIAELVHTYFGDEA